MIIASIDLMGGKAVQLRQGKELVLTHEQDPVELAKMFNRYGEVAVIDLDAALGQGDNLPLIREICKVADVRTGGGIRDKARGQELLRAGAQRIIIGTAATPEFLSQFPAERVMVALDHVDGKVVDQGWTHTTEESFLDRAHRLADYCGSFLCTFVADEGTLKGMDIEAVKAVQKALPKPVTIAGGVAHTEEAITLSKLGLDVQVGMALYTSKLDPIEAVIGSLDFEKVSPIPTVVQDEAGQILMLAYSTPESLRMALEEGRGIYYSRSRSEIWEKGKTSGHTQELLRCRTDCDRDALVFTVRQTGPACHTEAYSCFGSGLRQRDFSLNALFETLKQRKAEMPEGSFTTKLLENRKFLMRKLMEEAFEVCISESQPEYVWEIADVLYFMSVIAVDEGVEWSQIVAELGGRHR